MKFFAAAILAATAFAVKQDDENSQMDGNMDPMDPPMNSGMRILEAIDEDQNGEIDSWEAYEAGQFMLEAGILTEEDLITIESAFGDRDSVPIQEVAEWFEMNENEIPQDVVRMIEDEILEMAGAEMWYDALDNADSNYDGVLQRDEVEGGLRFAVDNEWMSREEADEIRDFMMMADMNGNDDEEVTMEEAFGALAMMMEDDPDMRQQMLDDAFDMIEDEQDMYAEWEEYDQSDDWENWEECPECAEWQDEMWEDEEAYCWEHGCPDIWEEDCDEGCPEA